MDDHTLEAIPNPIIIYNSAWNIIKANKAAIDTLGFTDMEELVNESIFSLVYSHDHKRLKDIQEQLQDAANLEANVKLTHTKKTNNSPPRKYVSQFTKIADSASNEYPYYLESSICLENSDASFEQIQQDLIRYNILSENIHGLEMFLVDKDLNIQCKLGRETFNQGWHRNLKDETDFLTYFNPGAISVLKPLLKIAFEQTPVIHEFSTNKEYFSLRLIPLDHNKEEQLFVIVLQNITQTKLIENRLKASIQEAEKANHAKDSFVAKMSHEIRTPLNAITGFTEQLGKTRLTKKQSDYNQIISNASKHLLSVVKGILELSKIESGQIDHELVPFKIKTILQEIGDVLELKYTAKNLKFNILCECIADEFLLGEPSKLRQVLINLANNAIKFTRKGSVTIKCTPIEKTGYQRTIKFDITDTGIGIDADDIKNIFKPFHQLVFSTGGKYTGCGLGLTISKELIESMGGTIEVDSTPGKGSTFTFCLNFIKAEKSDIASYEKVEQKKHLPLDQLRILFVDDDPVNLLLGRLILDEFGVKADFANSGSDALSKFKNGRYDIIFLDINMPDYNGMEITKHIRKEEKELEDNQKTSIIAMTANAMKKQIETYMQAGIDSVILKPYQEETLYRKIVSYAIKVDKGIEFDKPKILTGKSADFDLEHLLHFTKGDSAFTVLMLDTFLQSAQHGLRKIKSAYKLNDYSKIAETAHRLIPSLEQLGFKGITRLFKIIERRYLGRKKFRKDPLLIESAINELQTGIKTIKRHKTKLIK